MVQSLKQNTASRILFHSPELLEIQRAGFHRFLKQGIAEELAKKFPIKVKSGDTTLELIFHEQNFKLVAPDDSPRDCILKIKTYSCKLYVQIFLIFYNRTKKIAYQTEPEWVLLGHLPMMTKRGHFVINGSPRVIVHQIVRSPGIYFQKLAKKDEKNRARFYGDIIPLKGVWVRLQMTKKGRVEARFKKGKKVQVDFLKKCLELIEFQFLRTQFKTLTSPFDIGTSLAKQTCFARAGLETDLVRQGGSGGYTQTTCTESASALPYLLGSHRDSAGLFGPATAGASRHEVVLSSKTTCPFLPLRGTAKGQGTCTFSQTNEPAGAVKALVFGGSATKEPPSLPLPNDNYIQYLKFVEKRKTSAESKTEHDAFVYTYDKLYRTAEDKDLEVRVKKRKNVHLNNVCTKQSFVLPSAIVQKANLNKARYNAKERSKEVKLLALGVEATKVHAKQALNPRLALAKQRHEPRAGCPSGKTSSSFVPGTCFACTRRTGGQTRQGAETAVPCPRLKHAFGASHRLAPKGHEARQKGAREQGPGKASLALYGTRRGRHLSCFSGNLPLARASALQGQGLRAKQALPVLCLSRLAEHELKNRSLLTRVKKDSSSLRTRVKKDNAFKRKKCAENLVLTFKLESRYSLGELGRDKINTKFGLFKTEKQLSSLDIHAASNWLTLLRKGEKNIDDIDHAQNRRIRTSGELLQTQFENGVDRLKNLLVQKLKEWSLALDSSNQPFQLGANFQLFDAKNLVEVRAKLGLPVFKHSLFNKDTKLNVQEAVKAVHAMPCAPLQSKGKTSTPSGFAPSVKGAKRGKRARLPSLPLPCLGEAALPLLPSTNNAKLRLYDIHKKFGKGKGGASEAKPGSVVWMLRNTCKTTFCKGAQLSEAKLRLCPVRAFTVHFATPKMGVAKLRFINSHARSHGQVCFARARLALNASLALAKQTLPYLSCSGRQTKLAQSEAWLRSCIVEKGLSYLHLVAKPQRCPSVRSTKGTGEACFKRKPCPCEADLLRKTRASEISSACMARKWLRHERVAMSYHATSCPEGVRQEGTKRQKSVQSKALSKQTGNTSLKELFTTKPINGALREFFGSNPLSQYMDQTNPLAELTHKRRLSSLGIGGVSRESAGMAIRGIHATHYGRICPIETPEGKNAGLVNSLAFYTQVDKNGFLKTPYYQVFKGQVQPELGFTFCGAKEEASTNLHIAPNDLQQSWNNVLRPNISVLRANELLRTSKSLMRRTKSSVPVRLADNLLDVFKKIDPYQVDCIGISPVQMISVATSLIPFLEHNDANRALMGSNMQRQAVPLMISERPIVGTGLESLVLVESGHITESQLSGFVSYVSAKKIVVESLCTTQRYNAKVRRKKGKLPLAPACFASEQSKASPLPLPVDETPCPFLPFSPKARARSFASLNQMGSATTQALALGGEATKVRARQEFKACFWCFAPTGTSAASPPSRSHVTYLHVLPSLGVWWLLGRCATKHHVATKVKEQEGASLVHVMQKRSPQTEHQHKVLASPHWQGNALPAFKTVTQASRNRMRAKHYFVQKSSKRSRASLVQLIQRIHPLDAFQRSNQNTCITEKPLVRESDWVQKGDILTDCSASENGELAVGKNVLVAYIPWEGYNFEDAIVISERLVKEHIYTSLHIERYVFQAQDLKDGNEWFTRDLPGVTNRQISHLDQSGFPKIGTFLKEGDILVGKIRYLNKKPASSYEKLLCDILGERNFAARNQSLYVPKGVEARVINHRTISFFQSESENKIRPAGAAKMVHIFLGEKRVIQVGDKMSGRHGNKGVISTILPRQDMPYLPDGTPIDLILNPLGVPSRMNVGQVLECLLGLAASYSFQHFKMTAFDELYGVEASQSLVYLKLYQARLQSQQNWLFQVDFPGKVRLIDGRSGECFDQWITVGRAYILKLIHMVTEKIHARGTGPYALITQQPLRGRSNKGGQRLGEMEVWAFEGFGAAYTLQELLTKKSDDFWGRKQIVDSILPYPSSIKDVLKPHLRVEENKRVLGQPEIFKVLLCELQALCLDVGVYTLTSESLQRRFLGVIN